MEYGFIVAIILIVAGLLMFFFFLAYMLLLDKLEMSKNQPIKAEMVNNVSKEKNNCIEIECRDKR